MKTVHALWMLLLSQIGVSAVGYIPPPSCLPTLKAIKMQKRDDADASKRWLDEKTKKTCPRVTAFILRFFVAAEKPTWMILSGACLRKLATETREYLVLLKEFTIAVGGCVTNEMCEAVAQAKVVERYARYSFYIISALAVWDFIKTWQRTREVDEDKVVVEV